MIHSSIILSILIIFIVNNKTMMAESHPEVTTLHLSTEEGFRIYQHWTNQALTSLMSAFLQAKMNQNELPSKLPAKFTQCYLHAQDVPAMAKCVTELLQKKFETKIESNNAADLKRFQKYKNGQISDGNDGKQAWIGQFRVKKDEFIFRKEKVASSESSTTKYIRLPKYKKVDKKSQIRRRFKRFRRSVSISTGEIQKFDEKISSSNYALRDAKRTHGLSPVGGLASLLMAGILGRKQKVEKRPWQETVAKVQKLQQFRDNPINKNTMKTVEKLKPAREISFSMDDGIPKTNHANVPKHEKPIDEQISELVRDGIRLGMRLAKAQQQNGTLANDNEDKKKENEEELRMDFLSPRFLSITKGNSDAKGSLYSPSVFSLHNKGQGMERDLSLPKLMKDAQLTGRDQQEWLDLVMEASGVNQQVDALQALQPGVDGMDREDDDAEQRYKREFKGLYFTKEKVRDMLGNYEERKIDHWRQELDRTGYSLLNGQQLEFIYGPTSPFNDSNALRRLAPIVRDANSSTLNKLVEMDIQRLAAMESFDLRQRDIVLTPSVFSPTVENSGASSQSLVLSPAVFSPTIRSPTIFGPAILSPSVFSPGIQSPRLMSPLVLSPFIFSTLVLSPIVMQPYILSPGVINGVILSPFVMNPVILSPQIMHPFILSPLVMTPGILNPTLLSPLVLSPFIMNPQVFSPKAFAGLFLSPYSLSPVFRSPVYYYLVALSPSILS